MESPPTAGFWLSPQQKRVWTLQEESRAYRSVCLFELEKPWSAASVSAAVERLVARHEILRTICVRQTGMKFPFQVVLENASVLFDTVDLSGLQAGEQESRLREIFETEQVPSVGPSHAPVLTAKLFLLEADRVALLLSVPAMSADHRSLMNLVTELETSDDSGKETEDAEALRYVQFAQWQNDLVEGEADENADKGREFWEQHIDPAAPALAIPNEQKAAGGFAPEVYSCDVAASELRRLKSQAANLKATEEEILLAAWQSLLWRLTRQSMFPVGVVFDGREYDELRDLVGPVAKTIPIGARFDGNFRFREAVEHVRDSVSAAAEWQEYYVPGTGFGTEPPVSFEFHSEVFRNTAPDLLQKIFVCQDFYKLKLSAVQGSDRLALNFQYDATHFSTESVECIAGYFRRLLAGAVENPAEFVNRLPLLDEEERNRLLFAWNQTSSDYARDKTFHELFEAQAAATPDRPALRFQETVISYRQLNEQSNQLAHFLRASGVRSDSLVGLCVERSAEMLVALLGILKAGGAYVPLNPDNPKPRLSQQLANVVVLITEQKLLQQMPEFGGKVFCLDRDENCWTNQPTSNFLKSATPNNLAYVIYTSGSTGVPKGVAVRHRNLVNYSQFITQRLRLTDFPEGLNFATVSTIGADLGNTCIFPALISGGCLHIVAYDDATDPHRFARYTAKHPIDVLKIVPSHLQALLQSQEAGKLLPRKFLILGGEALTPALVGTIEATGGECEVINHYGPTETTIGSLTLRLADYDWKNSQAASIPIGKPIANTQVYILDPLLQPVSTGAVGELYIAGDGVTAGYLNQPERTEERFLPNPFANDPEAKMYRTGDLARYLSDGNVEFLGRSDDQIKIRGFRIELGEIESVLTGKKGVKQAVVMAREDARGDKRLVAYVVADHEQGSSAEDLRAHVKGQLPEFMVPSAVVLLARIPLTPNGKIDRQALPEPEAVTVKTYVSPETPTEEKVAAIWEEVLRRERISSDDNFFDLGGHSLLATQVVSRIRERFRVELPIRALFEHPTIQGLAGAIDSSDQSLPLKQESVIVRVSREAYRASRS